MSAQPVLRIDPTNDPISVLLRGTGGSGALSWIPRGTPHTFANLSGHQARTLVLQAKPPRP